MGGRYSTGPGPHISFRAVSVVFASVLVVVVFLFSSFKTRSYCMALAGLE